MFKFKASDLPEILTRWSARYSVFVPSGSPDNAQMRIWSRRTRKEVRFMEPDEYTNLIVAPKGFVFGEREELFRWEGNEKTCTAISAPSSSSLQDVKPRARIANNKKAIFFMINNVLEASPNLPKGEA